MTSDTHPAEVARPQEPLRSGRLLHLDVVRGIAILLVLGQHTPGVVRIHPVADAVSDHFHKYGYLGVDLFFVLSGFLIGGLLFQELDRTGTLRVRRFLARRALKIWPAYLVCLTACCLVTGLLGRDAYGAPTTLGAVFADMWPAYLHVQNYFPSTGRFVWFWSLGVEEHFYLLLPAALLLLGARGAPADGRTILRRVVWLSVGVGAVCLVLRGWALRNNPNVGGYTHLFPTHLRIDSLMAGVLLAAVVRFAPEKLAPLRPWRWLFGLVALALFVFPTFLPEGFAFLYPFDCTLVTLASVGVVVLAYFADLPAAVSSPAPPGRSGWPTQAVAFIGFYSYSIYLWHGYFGPAFAKRVMDVAHIPMGGTGFATVAHLMIYLSVAVLLGVVAFWVVEWPFLALRDRLFPRQARVAVLLDRNLRS